MVVFRGGGPPVPLSTVGVPWNRRFTFYDQVHTTGMDIKQCATARAAITVSKDTILRDYAQGAWRMRGIGIGQTIVLLVTPALKTRIRDTLPKVSGDLCLDTVALLVVQEQRMQGMQAAKLLEQDVANVFRRRAFAALQYQSDNASGAKALLGVRHLQAGFPSIGSAPNTLEWTLLLHHELSPSEPIFWPKGGAPTDEIDEDEAGFGRRFSRLGEIERFRNADGAFEFALQYPGGKGDKGGNSWDVHLHWRQASSPLEESPVAGFAPIHVRPGFGGLRLGGDGALLTGD
eukprot:4762283-Prymnesium_polylepis.1